MSRIEVKSERWHGRVADARRTRRRFPLTSWESLEARQLLAHATIDPANVKHAAALVAGLAPAMSRKPALDPALETLFLQGVEREVVGITPSPGLVAPYLKMLEHGVPRVQVLERLLESPAARDATVAYAYELLLHRAPSAAENRAMATKLARGGDLRTLMVSLASSREYYVSQGGGTEAGFLNALKEDLLGATAPMPDLPRKLRRPDDRTRSALVRAIVFSKEFDHQFLEAAALQITGASMPSHGLIVQARNALQRPGGMTRALAILLASDAAREAYAQRERLAELPVPPNPTPSPTQVNTSTPQSLPLTVPTDFGGALDFNAVSTADTFSGQAAPTVALPNGLIDQAGNQLTYELWFNAQTSGALLQMQLSGNGQNFNVPILAVDANGKLTGGLFDVDASGKLAPGLAGSAPSLSTTASSTTASIPIAPTLPSPMTSPLTLDYTVNSQSNNNPYTYQVVGPNNAMVSAATVLDQNWHEAALVVGGYALQLMFWGDGSGVPTSGANLVIAGTDSNGLLHIRTFDSAGVRTDTFEVSEAGALHLVSVDASGKVLSDEPESATQAGAIKALKQQLPGWLPPHVLIGADRNQVLGEVSSIVDRTLEPAEEYLYLDGLLVGAAQPADHYSLGFTDASGDTYAPTGAGFLGGSVAPLPISAAAQPPGIGYPAGFVGALSEMQIWSVARTTAQIEQAMDAPLALDPTPTGLIGYYDFSPLNQIETLNGPQLAQISVGASGSTWALDQTGTVQRYTGTAFQPIKTPAPAKMLAVVPDDRVQGGSAAYVIDTSNNLYTVAPSGSVVQDTPTDATSGAPLPGPSWVGVSNGGTPWMISGGKIYFEDNNGFNQGDWWPESFTGSPTSVAPLGASRFFPYGNYEQWGSVQVRALVIDASHNLWISVQTGDDQADPSYQEARVLLSRADTAPQTYPLSQVYTGQDGSVWAIDTQQNVYKLVSVIPDGSTYDCSFVEMPQLHGTTSLAVNSIGTIFSVISGATYEWVPSSPQWFANRVPGSPFGPATTAAQATGTSLSASYVVAGPSTIPADPFVGVPRLSGYQDFAPYLAVPYSNSAPTVDLAAGPNQVEYQVTLDVGDTVLVEVPGGQSVDGPFQVDFLGFTTNPADGSHPVLVSYPQLAQVSNEQGLNDLIQNNMAAAFIAPASGTYLIRITGPAQGNSANSAVQLQFSVLPGNSNSLLTLVGTQTVQGGGGTTVDAYTDPAAPPGATINQLLPTSDPQVAAYQQQAYQALVQAAKDIVGPSESFTDFLNLNTGVTITPEHLFGLQDQAYQAVTENPAKYLGTASPSKFLLSALDDVHDLLDTVDSQRQNVYAFVQAQDSWIQNDINNILGQNTLSTIAQTIVDNQDQDNPPAYLQPPPPTTPYAIGASIGIQAGKAAVGILTQILKPLLFTGPAAPFGVLFSGLINLGATLGATYGTDALKQATTSWPTLVVPPDKNNISTLIQAASTYQNQLIAGLNALQNLANDPQFLFPLFSNVGLLRALANLNPLVLDSKSSDDQLGPNNPTAAAVTSAAWQTLLPDYFKWVPIDPTTESQSQNFNNFYPGATTATAGDATKQLAAMQLEGGGLALQLMPWGNGSGVPTSGNNLVIVGIDNNGLLHIRIFDAGGNLATDTDETKLPSTEAGAISTLKQQIPGLLPPHVLSETEEVQLINEATSIVGENPAGQPYQYPGFSETDQIYPSNDVYPPYAPTSMAIFPTGSVSSGETQHPERFFTLLEANLTETADTRYSDGYGDWLPWNSNVFKYGDNGLYVSGWELVDKNGIEIDPRTAALVFPATGSPIQPVTNGPELVAFGGGSYLNVAPPPPYQGSSLYATQATPSEVFLDWFHQTSLAPSSPVSGTLSYGTNGNQYVQTSNPHYSVAFPPIIPVPPSFPLDAINDPGFEEVQLGDSEYQPDPTGSPWSFSGSAGISANVSTYTASNPPAPEGSQVAYLEQAGAFSQSVAGWAAGSYQLTFQAAQRANWPAGVGSTQDFTVLVDGNAVGTFKPSSTSYQSYTTAPFTVTAGSHTITFQGLDTAGGDDTAFIDQVVLEVTGQPQIADNGFEQVSVGAGGFLYDPTGSPWTFTPMKGNGGSGIAANNSGFTGGNPPAPEGAQVAFLQGPVTISQSVAGWAPGTYQVSFAAAQRGNFQASQQDFQVLIDGTVLGTFKPSGTSYQTYTTAPFTVTAGAHTITFQGLDSAGGDNTALIDEVVASPSLFVAQPPIADQGFEQVHVGAGQFLPDPTGSPWSFSGSVGISANNSGYSSGNPPAPQGTQVAYLQGAGSWFSQDVPGWATGSYQITFKAAQRGNTIPPSHQDFEVLVDGNVVGKFKPSGTSYETYTTAPFTVTAGTHTITFQGLDSAGGDNTALIDQVVASPVTTNPQE